MRSHVENLEDGILEMFTDVYRNDPKKELRWFEIRNSMLRNEKISLETRKNVQAFSVKLSRRLDALVSKGILVKHNRAHKDVTYSLDSDFKLKILKEKGLNSYIGTYPLDVRPDDTYEQFKRKALKAWLSDIQRMMEPQIRKEYEKMRKEWRNGKNERREPESLE
jgi:hypothetical protein